MTPPRDPDLQTRTLIDAAVAAPTASRLNSALTKLSSWSRTESAEHLDRVLSEMVTAPLPALWERGWAPAEFVHVVRRESGESAGLLAATLVLEDATLQRDSVPTDWRVQLDDLRELRTPAQGTAPVVITRHAIAQGLRAVDGWREGVQVLRTLRGLRPLRPVLTPPSRWDSEPELVLQVGAGGTHDPGLLSKIRALLAKAESTTFPAEARALGDKAQELMSRHEIVTGVLAGVSAVGSRRVLVEEPHAEMKAQLLSVIGQAHRARAVWEPDHGWLTVVGHTVDLDRTELIHASLLIQAVRGMVDHPDGGRTSPAFRRAFLLAFAQRIGERLLTAAPRPADTPPAAEEGSPRTTADDGRASRGGADDDGVRDGSADAAVADWSAPAEPDDDAAGRLRPREPDGTPSADLVSRVADRGAALESAVAEEFERQFPATRPGRSRMVDAAGWESGRRAADRATLLT